MQVGETVNFYAGFVLIALTCAFPQLAHAALDIEIFYVERQVPQPPTLSNLVAPPKDEGAAGARLAIEDNATTGKFLGHKYSLRELIVPPKADFISAVKKALAERPASYVVANAPADDLLALADLPELKTALIFNASATDTRLREADCRANVLHTAPSRAMLADALMQFLVKKRWTNLFLVVGPNPPDKLFAEAIRNAIKKFRVKLVAEKPWPFAADMRRTAQSEVPVFTQDVDYDVLIVADETHDFGQYLLYQTWLPRPVAGTQGLKPTAWDPVIEQWGAAQLQSRFEKVAGRPMRSKDFTVWSAVRIVGEAVTQVNSGDFGKIVAFIRSPEARFAQYKKVGLNFRPWNGQLRQPIPLVHPGAVVALPPLPGFLHQGSELDTLGVDAPESKCELK
jgi:ABC transporter substrate binding protein (PQQ-dependent alcohol dehydrogenase system)